MADQGFEVVQRPRGGGNVPDALMKALIETVNTDKAVRVKLDGHAAFTNWQATIRARLRTDHQLRLRTKFNKANNVVTAWVEKFDPRETGEGMTDEDLGVSEDKS
jgi:hypothetical protein